jgi:hypothetical protein
VEHLGFGIWFPGCWERKREAQHNVTIGIGRMREVAFYKGTTVPLLKELHHSMLSCYTVVHVPFALIIQPLVPERINATIASRLPPVAD